MLSGAIETQALRFLQEGRTFKSKNPTCSNVSIFKAKAPLLDFELNLDVLRMKMLHVGSPPWVCFEEGTRKTSPQLHQMEQEQQTGRRKPPSMLQRK